MQDALDRLVSDWAGHSHVHEVVLCIDFEGQRWSACAGHWQGGPVTPRTPHFIASTSKLFATAMLLSLQEDGRLSLDDPVAGFFGQGELAGLHRWRGQDLTGQITLRHLLAHRSGLPDHFEGKRLDSSRFAERLLAGHDLSYGWPQVLHWTREEMRPHFRPGQGRRARYSDSNFYLLGEVTRRVSGGSLEEALAARVTGPLGLEHTAFYRTGLPALPLRQGERQLQMPLAMASMPVDGGVVSTAQDMLTFTQALFGGRFCAAKTLAGLQDWCRVFFPLQAGAGLLRFALPRWLLLGRRYPPLLGHSGISGAFAFHCPEWRCTLTGTVNQIDGRARPYRLMLQALDILGRAR